jgi:hypothetical protein
MVKTLLVSQIVADGAMLLRELDRQSFAVETMFWIDVPEHHYWQLVIASPRVSTDGSAAIYRTLWEMIRTIGVSGFELADVSVLEPKSQQFLDYRSVMESSSRIDIEAEWVVFEDGIIYRWTGASVTAELDCEISAERLAEIWEAERRFLSNNLPRLLFTVEGRRVTMRFHPQHGSLGGIQNIQHDFLRALQRSGDLPRCNVQQWLPA